MTKQTTQLVVMLIIGILIGVIAVKVFMGEQSTRNVSESTTTAGTTVVGSENKNSEPVTSRGESFSQAKEQNLPPAIPANTRVGLTVLDQSPGITVAVSGLNVDVVSWVAIYDERDGRPTVILGAQKVKPGETATMVELLRHEGTIAGMTYFAAILPDNGDGVFNKPTDLPPFSPEKWVIVKFKAL